MNSDEMVAMARQHPGMFMMLICECDHKQHGHKDDIGQCSRCDCKEFTNTTHYSIGGERII
jgi:hypothetical protein